VLSFDFDKPDLSLSKAFRNGGASELHGRDISAARSIEYVLEEGERYDWFDDRPSRPWTVARLCRRGILTHAQSWRSPIVDLKA